MVDYFIIFLASMYIAPDINREEYSRRWQNRKNVASFPGWALVKKSRNRNKKPKNNSVLKNS
ncbi:hypothetical protein CKO_04892 [Citrobacter koseri ATCC BAA-895]|uniref:Uncharacterized protein n=1 Tax=Citrobacter koseri (strain ATCC BAA-895 / CDC 4225-83 / SGSC4696) TaxID=290338 RepID=A8AR23_CITK8|nr:hypothetical protein CKO_04892 [Citrobacter koseri ATCC BAA-895]